MSYQSYHSEKRKEHVGVNFHTFLLFYLFFAQKEKIPLKKQKKVDIVFCVTHFLKVLSFWLLVKKNICALRNCCKIIWGTFCNCCNLSQIKDMLQFLLNIFANKKTRNPYTNTVAATNESHWLKNSFEATTLAPRPETLVNKTSTRLTFVLIYRPIRWVMPKTSNHLNSFQTQTITTGKILKPLNDFPQICDRAAIKPTFRMSCFCS